MAWDVKYRKYFIWVFINRGVYPAFSFDAFSLDSVTHFFKLFGENYDF